MFIFKNVYFMYYKLLYFMICIGSIMNKKTFLKLSILIALLISINVFYNTLQSSKALSYLSTDPKACINCHVMNTAYATWQHSSHFKVKCVECHLPTDNIVDKYIAKARDGYNHSLAFTLNTYKQSMKITEDGADRVQKNCVSCHASLISSISSTDKYHSYDEDAKTEQKRCWECHKSVPHGTVRAITTTPYNLGVQEVK